jgi:hypothetical protein
MRVMMRKHIELSLSIEGVREMVREELHAYLNDTLARLQPAGGGAVYFSSPRPYFAADDAAAAADADVTSGDVAALGPGQVLEDTLAPVLQKSATQGLAGSA